MSNDAAIEALTIPLAKRASNHCSEMEEEDQALAMVGPLVRHLRRFGSQDCDSAIVMSVANVNA